MLVISGRTSDLHLQLSVFTTKCTSEQALHWASNIHHQHAFKIDAMYVNKQYGGFTGKSYC